MNKTLFFISILLISSIYSANIEGIDVSYYQGDIDWEEVKTEKQFAIIRMGYGQKKKDDKYEEYYKGAKDAGVQLGAYLFSKAESVDDAEKEAEHALDLLKGKQFEWPIYYDIEADALNKGDVNAKLDKFCTILQENNYFCGVYSSASPLKSKFDSSVLAKYAVWVANYGVDHPSYSGDWGIWQYSDKGKVSGIKADVDLDVASINYADVIMSKGFNGY